MIRKKLSVLYLLAGVGIAATLSCATQTQIVSSWHVPLANRQPLKKLVVIGLLKSHDHSKEFEMSVADQFEAAGINAVPGFTVLGEDTTLTKKEMERRVKASGADGVLLYKMIAVDRSKQYVPPTEYLTPVEAYVPWWDDRDWGYYHPYPFDYWGYWYPAYQVVRTRGYWEHEATYRVEGALYRVSDGRLIWTAVSKTYNPEGKSELAASISRTTLDQLLDEHIVEKS